MIEPTPSVSGKEGVSGHSLLSGWVNGSDPVPEGESAVLDVLTSPIGRVGAVGFGVSTADSSDLRPATPLSSTSVRFDMYPDVPDATLLNRPPKPVSSQPVWVMTNRQVLF